MKAKLVSCLLLVAFSLVTSSCDRSDDIATGEKAAAEDREGINAQVIEALKIVQSKGPVNTSKAPDGPAPKSETDYINLSLRYYQEKEWEKCIEAGIGALNFNPASATAYNNICAAYIQLKDFDRAILACNKALALNPDFPRARGNLNAAIRQRDGLDGG